MTSGLLAIDVQGRATTPARLVFDKAYFDRANRKIAGRIAAPKGEHWKLGGAEYSFLDVEVTEWQRNGEPHVTVQRMMIRPTGERTNRYDRSWIDKAAAPLRKQVAEAIQRAGGLSKVWESTFVAKADQEYGYRAAAQSGLEYSLKLVAHFQACVEIADAVAAGDAELVFDIDTFHRDAPTVLSCRFGQGGSLDFQPAVARIVLAGEQIGWLTSDGTTVPLRSERRL